MSAAPEIAHARLGAIDGLRCLAMTAVVMQHCGILPFGWTGVWLFYVISGYVVTRSIASLPSDLSSGGKVAQFYGKRAARILPAYLAYILVGFVWTAMATGDLDWRILPSLILFYNNFAASIGGVESAYWPMGHLWTISVEMQFYFVFGAMLIMLPRSVLLRVLAATIVLAVIARIVLSAVLHHYGLADGVAAYIAYTFSPAHFDAFALGSLAALTPSLVERRANRRTILFWAAAAFAIYCIAQIAANAGDGRRGADLLRNVISGDAFGHQQEIYVYSVVALISLALLITAIANQSKLSAALSHPGLRFIGERSYGAYVFHAAILGAVHPMISSALGALGEGMGPNMLRGAATFVIAYPITILFAHLSYQYFERPIIRAHARALKPPSAPMTTAAPQP